MKAVYLILVCLLLSLSLVLGSFGCAKPAPPPSAELEPVKFIWNALQADTSGEGPGVKYFTEEVTRRSGGKITWDIYWSSALGYPRAETLAVTSAGTVPFSSPSTDSSLPSLDFSSLPLFMPEMDDWYKVNDKVKPLFSKVLTEQWNVIFLGNYHLGPTIFGTNKEINSWKDYAGIKMRTYSAITADWAKNLGMIPVSIPFAEVYTSLKLGTADGAITAPANFLTQKFYEAVNYGVSNYQGYGNSFFVVNKNIFDGLPQEYQKALMDSVQPTEEYVRKVRLEELEAAFVDLEAKGMKFTTLPPAEVAEMRKMAEPLWDIWAANMGVDADTTLKLGKEAMGY